jgi:diguanylate cyclase (GGDEF)-like protein
LFALSLVLLLVNGTLSLMAYRHSAAQFELQQSEARANQSRQLRGLLERNFSELNRLVSVIPIWTTHEGDSPNQDFVARLRLALGREGALIGLEWDIRSVLFIAPDGRLGLVWPADTKAPEAELVADLSRKDDGITQLLSCHPECLQYLAAPLLLDGKPAGTLVLGRSIADALLAFNTFTGNEVAVYTTSAAPWTLADLSTGFPAMTHPSLTDPIIRALAPWLTDKPVLGEFDGLWYELFRVDDVAPEVGALVVDEVTAARQVIQAAARNSILLGLGGLLLSGLILFWMGHISVGRLRRIASVLPLLAENRYVELREGLPPVGGRLTPEDELDQLTATAQALTDRMERLQRDREEAEVRLLWLADHDSLTRLYNRRRFSEDCGRILDQARRYGHQGAMIFMDLDQFKDVNDVSGHQVGDLLLQQVAEQLSHLIRTSDVLARLGGDEFALVLPESTETEALACAGRIQAAVQSIQVNDHGRVHRVTASIGIAIFPDQGGSAEELLANADIALFQAKEKGRGRCHLFSVADHAREQADARITWRDQIAEGLRHGRFKLHFQPIVALETGAIHHWESLLRLHDAQGTLIFPDRFIPVAEKTGQIQAIDHWVMAHAVQRLGQVPHLRLSVNLSASAMGDPSLLSNVERLLDHYRVDPGRLIFEVTESAAVSSLTQATELMRAIQQLGCGFALDDFGSGYASYAYLRRLPVDEVKIDGAFVRDLAHNREDRIFVKAITDMAHGMGKTVTAEYVETEAIYRVLGDLGVDYAQGYFLGRPAVEPEPGPWLRARSEFNAQRSG